MLEQHIKSLIEKRTIEAAKKEMAKKLHTIARIFGKPIIEQFVPYSELPNFWEMDAPEILEAEDDHIELKGYYFDGLKSALNLCIQTTVYDGQLYELKATWNGHQVFHEILGDLKSYAPFDSWESAVDRLYASAVPAAEEKMKVENQDTKERNRKRAMTFLEKLRMLWGI